MRAVASSRPDRHRRVGRRRRDSRASEYRAEARGAVVIRFARNNTAARLLAAAARREGGCDVDVVTAVAAGAEAIGGSDLEDNWRTRAVVK